MQDKYNKTHLISKISIYISALLNLDKYCQTRNVLGIQKDISYASFYSPERDK